MQLKHLRSFLAVAESRHFGRAAVSLGLTHPAVSIHLAHLEKAVGAKLLSRDRRSVELTPAGQVLLEGARSALGRLDEAAAKARALGEDRAKTLLVGQLDYVSHAFLPQAIRSLKARFPEVIVETLDLSPEQAVAAVREREVDLGFCYAFQKDPGLVQREVMKGRWMLVLPKTHPLAKLEAVPLKKLKGEPLILFHRRISPTRHAWFMRQFEEAGFTPHLAHQIAQPQHGPALVELGVGLFIAGSYVLTELPPKVVTRPLTGFPSEISVVAVWRAGERTPLLRAFLEGLPKHSPAAAHP